MKIVRTIAELPLDLTKSTGLVPTMGALHEGHLELMRISAQENDLSIASIFVNPTQFAPHEDFHKYPRNLERDAELAASAGIDLVFAPSVEEMYPRKTTRIEVDEVTALWEGERRPGHFTGVATIVGKLFNIVRPTRAYFGWKDLQQCLTIRRMVEDLNFPLALRLIDTIRESDGLAMSSRNAYLSSEDRRKAPALYESLLLLRDTIVIDSEKFEATLASAHKSLQARGFEVEYLDWISLETLRPVRSVSFGESAIIIAARLGTTRLIDNLRLS